MLKNFLSIKCGSNEFAIASNSYNYIKIQSLVWSSSYKSKDFTEIR